jgi:methionine-S-sulfoxide reductase
MMHLRVPLLLLAFALVAACHGVRSQAEAAPEPARAPASTPAPVRVGGNPGHAGFGTALAPTGHNQLAAFAAGCFWGVEDAFRHVPGIVATAVGYSGGHTNDPTYEKVCTHTTGHAETVLIEYDPTRVPYEQLLRAFFKIHDPTELNRQGPDVGDQYRSAVFTFSSDQDAAARAALQAEQKLLGRSVVTQIQRMGAFYKAEDYHQQYAEKTGSHACPIAAQLETL